jgi:hypothetical protein
MYLVYSILGVSTTSRIHGRNGIAYVGVDPSNGTGGAQILAAPMAFLSDWSINFVVAKVDVTAMGDNNLIWVAGLPDASGDFTGFYDTSTAQTYVAATDGQARNFYLYPSTVSTQMGPPAQYFFGTILPDFAVAGGVTAAVSLKSTWNAASRIQRYPTYGLAGT